MINNFEITHVLINKNNEEQIFYSKNISDISTRPINMQDIKAQIDDILNTNKNECVVS
jgi:hypothetical protein